MDNYAMKQKNSNKKNFKDFARSYYAGNESFDNRFREDIRQRLNNLKSVGGDKFLGGEDKENGRILRKITNINEYFLDKEKFKSFQKKVSETISATIKAKKPNKQEILGIEAPKEGLKDIEKNQAKLYWDYMSRPYITNDIKGQIIGTTKKGNNNNEELSDDTTKFIEFLNNSLSEVGELQGFNTTSESGSTNNEEGTNKKNKGIMDSKGNPLTNEKVEEPPAAPKASDVTEPNANDKNAQNSAPNNEYMDYDIERITDILNGMPKHYDSELLKKQDELNKQCTEKIEELRNMLLRYGKGKDFFGEETQGQNQNQNQPKRYFVTTQIIYHNMGPTYFPTTEPEPKVEPSAENQATNQTTNIPQNGNNVQPAVNTNPTLEIAPPLPESQGNVTTKTQEIANSQPASPVENKSSQSPADSVKSENEKPAQTNFLDYSEWGSANNFGELEKKIASVYDQKLLEAYEELRNEFIKKQKDAFAAFRKNRAYNDKVDEIKKNIEAVPGSRYGFNVSTGDFLNELGTVYGPSPNPNPTPTKEANGENSEENTDDKTTFEPENNSNDNNGYKKTEDFLDIDFLDIIDGKIYQSNFLEAVASSLLPLYSFMKDDNNKRATIGKGNNNEKNGFFSDLKKKVKGVAATAGEKISNAKQTISELLPEKTNTGGAFSEEDMGDLISSLYSTKDSNIYNLRLLHQREIVNKKYAEYGGAGGDTDAIKKYFQGEYGEDGRVNKGKGIGGLEIKTAYDRFRYTRALLRAYICIKNNVKNINGTKGATGYNPKDGKELIKEGIYTDFMEDISKSTSKTSVAETCRKYSEQCQHLCEQEDKESKHDYTYLVKCLKKVAKGNQYDNSDLKEALNDNCNKDCNSTILNNIIYENAWLHRDEGSTVLNVQWDAIEKNIR